MLYSFFRYHIDYVFFLYGLSFFILGGVSFLLAKEKKDVAAWFWLGLFGLVHAANEWLDLVAIIINDSPVFKFICLTVLVISFSLLIEFSRKSLDNLSVKMPGAWVHIPLIVSVYLGFLLGGFGTAGFIAHSVLGFGAAASACVTFFVLSLKNKTEFKLWFKRIGILFGFYAFSKLVSAQPVGIFAKTLFNQDIFFDFFSFPVQLFRCALAISCSLVLWIYWYLSQPWIHINLSESQKRRHIIWMLAYCCIFIILGWFITQGVGEYYKNLADRDFIAKANTSAAAVNSRRILSLTGSSVDLNNPDYIRLKEQIREIKKVNADLAFVYLLRLEKNNVIFLVDSDQPTSPDYAPPGKIYKDVPLALREDFFKKETLIVGPYTDEWGTWFSAYAPIVDFETKEIISRIGMDVKMSAYQDRLFHHRIVGILITLGLFISLLSIFTIVELNKIAVNKVFYTQKHLQTLIDNIPTPIYYKNIEGTYLGSNIATEQFLGLTKDKIVGKDIIDIFPDEAVSGKYRQMDEELLKHPGIQVYEYKLRNIDGTDHEVIFNRSTYPGPDGKVAGIIGVIIDVTEQRRLEGSLRRLAVIVESSDDAIIGKDVNGVITSWNQGAEKIYGYSAQEAIGRPINIIIPPEIINESTVLLEKIRNGEHVEHYETVRITKDGRRLDMSLTISPLKDALGNIIGASTIAYDITRRKIIEDELKRKTELLEAQKEASLDGLMVVDENGQKILINKRLIELWQIPPYIANDKDDESQLQYVMNRVKNPEQFMEKVKYLYAHKDQTSNDEIEFKDGMVLERYSSPVIDKEGRYFGRIWSFRDITERKKFEEQIELAVEEWERTFNSISDLIFIQDKDFTITKINKSCCEILKLKPEDIIGKKCYQIFHNLDRPWPNCPTAKTQNDFVPHAEEVDDPNIGVPLLVTVSPIFNNKGELVGTVHVARDISERKKVEKALREIIEMKTDFTSTISHELRTPLAAIKEGISIVLDGTSGKISKDQKEFLDIAKRNVDRLTLLINDILDFQKLESGKMTFNIKPNDINETVKEVERMMRGIVEKKGLSLVLEFDNNLPKAQFDKDKIIQVLTNLVNNAVKFTEKGTIKIQTAMADNLILIMVKDTGIGIKESDTPVLFEKFRQLDSGINRKTGGTGLGLSICKSIIEKHNGRIWIESKFGEGSIFSFTLPVK